MTTVSPKKSQDTTECPGSFRNTPETFAGSTFHSHPSSIRSRVLPLALGVAKPISPEPFSPFPRHRHTYSCLKQ